MKRILITGARRGLGEHLRNYLLEKDCFIYGTTRDLKNIKNSNRLEFLYLDYTDKNSVDQIADYFVKLNEPIDALIHNSGIAYLDPADVIGEEESRHVFDVNFFGPISLTKKLLPLIRKANKGNLIFISSIVSVDHWPYLGVYAASKAAIEAIAFEWAVLLKHWNINVSVIQPNPLKTDMQILRSVNSRKSPYPDFDERKLDWENISDVCEIVWEILSNSSPQFQYQTGTYSQKTVQRFLKKDAY